MERDAWDVLGAVSTGGFTRTWLATLGQDNMLGVAEVPKGTARGDGEAAIVVSSWGCRHRPFSPS